MKITIKDIANHCGVGVGTVSRVINGGKSVSPAVRESVMEYIDKVGWRASNAAKTLKTGKTGRVAIIVNAINYFFANEMLNCLCHKFFEINYRPMISVKHEPAEIRHFANGENDGIIIFAPTLEMEPEIIRMQERGIPVISIGLRENKLPQMIYADKEAVGYDAVKLLQKNGHRKIAYCGMTINNPGWQQITDFPEVNTRQILQGIAKAQPDFNLRRDVIAIDNWGEDISSPALQQELSQRNHTAYVIWTPKTANHFYRHCHDLGLRIPEDVSLVVIERENYFDALQPIPDAFANDFVSYAERVIQQFIEPRRNEPEEFSNYYHVPGQSIRKIKS